IGLVSLVLVSRPHANSHRLAFRRLSERQKHISASGGDMKFRAGNLTALVFAVAVSASPMDNSIEQRIDSLVSRMTLDEKIGQMSQSTSMATPLAESIKTEIRQ